jgi:dolichol-phosphate mannosyltransferase
MTMRSGADACVPQTLVITPTLDERENVEELCARVLARPERELLLVDDASEDGTAEAVERLRALEPRIHLLRRRGARGLGRAYVDGFLWALSRGFDRIAMMDADLSHDPEDLDRLAEALEAGADLVVGSRNVQGGGIVGWGIGRHALSKGGSAYARVGLGLDVRDFTSGFKLWRRAALLAIDPTSLRSNGYSFQIETTARALERGLTVVEVPILFSERRAGQSKLRLPIVLEAALFVPRARLRRWLERG